MPKTTAIDDTAIGDFFIAKLVVPMDTIEDIMKLLGAMPAVKVGTQEYRDRDDTWKLTLECRDYSLVQDFTNWHRDGNIETLYII